MANLSVPVWASPVPATDQAERPVSVLWRVLPPIVTLLGLGAAVLLLWLPVGLTLPDRLEGWGILNVIDQGLPIITFDTDRPLRFLAWAVGHALASDSFLGVNLVVIACLIAKGYFAYAVLALLLPTYRACAVLGGFLVVFYPVDLALMDSRVANIQLSLALYLAGTYALCRYWLNRSVWAMVLALAAVVVSLEIYEAGYPMVLLTPLLCLWLPPVSIGRLIRTTLVWYLAPVVTLVHLGFVRLTHPLAYQEGILRAGLDHPHALELTLDSLKRAYVLHLWEGWGNTVDLLRSTPAYLPVVIPVAAVAVVCAVANEARPDVSGRRGPRYLLSLALVGLVLVGVGFAPYAPTILRGALERVFLFSAIGAGLLVAAVAALLTGWLPRGGALVRAALVGVLILGSAAFVCQQQQRLATASETQREVLVAMTRLAPTLPSETMVLLYDETGSNRLMSAFYDAFVFRNAVQYIYRDPPILAWLCHSKLAAWNGDAQYCRLGADAAAYGTSGFTLPKPYREVLLLQYTDEWGLEVMHQPPANLTTAVIGPGYQPEALLNLAAPTPARVATALSFPPAWPGKPVPVMVQAADLRLGGGWFAADAYGQDAWRGVINNAEIIVPPGAAARRLTLDLAPGDGRQRRPFTLQVFGADGRLLAQEPIGGRVTVQVEVPAHADGATHVRLHVADADAAAAGSGANFNVFKLY